MTDTSELIKAYEEIMKYIKELNELKDKVGDEWVLEELKNEFNLHMEVINSLPINNIKNKKQYILEVDKLIKSYEGKAKKIYDEAPANLSKHDKLIWCKKSVKEIFKYETKIPRWIQQPEWPIVDNRPLVFKYQKTSSEGVEQYFFYDPYTGETRIIEQVE